MKIAIALVFAAGVAGFIGVPAEEQVKPTPKLPAPSPKLPSPPTTAPRPRSPAPIPAPRVPAPAPAVPAYPAMPAPSPEAPVLAVPVVDPSTSGTASEVSRENDFYRDCANDEGRPKTLRDLDGGYRVFYSAMSEGRAIELNLIAGASAARNKSSVVQVFRFLQYAERSCSSAPTPVIWGIGTEAVLHVRKAASNIKLGLPFLAAAVQLNHAEVTFSMDTKGITGTVIRNVLPDAGVFNVDNYAKVMGAVDQVRKLLDDKTITVRPQLLLRLPGER